MKGKPPWCPFEICGMVIAIVITLLLYFQMHFYGKYESTPEPLYNTVGCNMILDITQIRDGPQMAI